MQFHLFINTIIFLLLVSSIKCIIMHFAENICYFIGNKDIQIFVINNNLMKNMIFHEILNNKIYKKYRNFYRITLKLVNYNKLLQYQIYIKCYKICRNRFGRFFKFFIIFICTYYIIFSTLIYASELLVV